MAESALRGLVPRPQEIVAPTRSWNPLNPAFRDTVSSAMSNLLGSSNIAGREGYDRSRYADMLTGSVDFVPGVSEAAGVGDVRREVQQGNYPGAALAGVATALGMVPVIGDAASRAIREGLDMSQAGKVNVSESGVIKGNADRMISQLPGRNELNLWIEKGDEAIESGWSTTGDPVVVLDKILIDPDLRQQGYGRRVLEQAIKDASEALPGGELKLLAEPLGGKGGIDSDDLIKFYESLGFSVDNYQQGMSGVPMSLMLQPSNRR